MLKKNKYLKLLLQVSTWLRSYMMESDDAADDNIIVVT